MKAIGKLLMDGHYVGEVTELTFDLNPVETLLPEVSPIEYVPGESNTFEVSFSRTVEVSQEQWNKVCGFPEDLTKETLIYLPEPIKPS